MDKTIKTPEERGFIVSITMDCDEWNRIVDYLEAYTEYLLSDVKLTTRQADEETSAYSREVLKSWAKIIEDRAKDLSAFLDFIRNSLRSKGCSIPTKHLGDHVWETR